MQVFRIDADINKYCGFIVNDQEVEEVVEYRMRSNQPVKPIWKGCRISVIPGKKGDFAASPFSAFAPIALSKRAVESLGEMLASVGELLPFSYRKDRWWMLYIPTPTDCLDGERTEYHTEHCDANNIRKAAFVREKLPPQHIFRIPGGHDYFVTEEFKRIVEEHGLTGLRFELMWSDKPTETAALQQSPPAPCADQPRVRKPGRRSKRDRLLERLWNDVINDRQSDEWWQEIVEADPETGGQMPAWLDDAVRVMRDAFQRGVSAEDLKRMARSLAYRTVFDTLVALEEEQADKGPLRCLHEDLLMANPDGYEE